jgi:hypothetical protein
MKELDVITRLELTGQYAKALMELRSLMQNPQTDLSLLIVLRSHEKELQSKVPIDMLAGVKGIFKRAKP